MRSLEHTAVLIAGLLLVVGIARPAQAQHPPDTDGKHAMAPSPRLQEPGQAVFGTVQEVIRTLEADSTTDWSNVDLGRLHRHLKDMQQVAVNVTVAEKTALENGVRLRVRPDNDAAQASLDRVIAAHPTMLKQETGWTMEVEKQDTAYVLCVTTSNPTDVPKIQALGYIGLLAYGRHHQRHHWQLLRRETPHGHSDQ